MLALTTDATSSKKSYTYFLHLVFLCSKRSYIFAGIVHDVNAMGNTENIDRHNYYVVKK